MNTQLCSHCHQVIPHYKFNKRCDVCIQCANTIPLKELSIQCTKCLCKFNGTCFPKKPRGFVGVGPMCKECCKYRNKTYGKNKTCNKCGETKNIRKFHQRCNTCNQCIKSIGTQNIKIICVGCQEEKPQRKYSAKIDGFLGKRSTCIQCDKIKRKIRYEKIKDTEEYKNKSRVSAKKYRSKESVKIKMRERNKKYRNTENGKKRITEYNNKPYVKAKRVEYGKKYRQSESGRKKINDYLRKKRKEDPMFRVRLNLSKLMTFCLKQYNNCTKNGKSFAQYVDYSMGELKEWLEARFEPGMTWDNYGRKKGIKCWEIDHVIAHCFFNISDLGSPLIKICYSLKNLQPMWADENRRKNNNPNHIREIYGELGIESPYSESIEVNGTIYHYNPAPIQPLLVS